MVKEVQKDTITLLCNSVNQGLISPTFSHTAFICTDPKSTKRQSSHRCLFALLKSAHTKAIRKMLVKSIHGLGIPGFSLIGLGVSTFGLIGLDLPGLDKYSKALR